jgi:hypothetical protein
MAEEWLPLRDASARLGVSTDTLRRRLKRGELVGEQRPTPHGPAWFVHVPADVAAAEVSPASDDQFDARLLQERIEGLTAQLVQAETDRDRWHQMAVDAIERAHREREEMRALLGREQAIALSATSGSIGNAQADAEAEPTHAQAHDVVARDAPEKEAVPQTAWQRFRQRLGFYG